MPPLRSSAERHCSWHVRRLCAWRGPAAPCWVQRSPRALKQAIARWQKRSLCSCGAAAGRAPYGVQPTSDKSGNHTLANAQPVQLWSSHSVMYSVQLRSGRGARAVSRAAQTPRPPRGRARWWCARCAARARGSRARRRARRARGSPRAPDTPPPAGAARQRRAAGRALPTRAPAAAPRLHRAGEITPKHPNVTLCYPSPTLRQRSGDRPRIRRAAHHTRVRTLRACPALPATRAAPALLAARPHGRAPRAPPPRAARGAARRPRRDCARTRPSAAAATPARAATRSRAAARRPQTRPRPPARAARACLAAWCNRVKVGVWRRPRTRPRPPVLRARAAQRCLGESHVTALP